MVLSLTAWLISLSIMLSSSIHAVAKGISSSPGCQTCVQVGDGKKVATSLGGLVTDMQEEYY